MFETTKPRSFRRTKAHVTSLFHFLEVQDWMKFTSEVWALQTNHLFFLTVQVQPFFPFLRHSEAAWQIFVVLASLRGSSTLEHLKVSGFTQNILN